MEELLALAYPPFIFWLTYYLTDESYSLVISMIWLTMSLADNTLMPTFMR